VFRNVAQIRAVYRRVRSLGKAILDSRDRRRMAWLDRSVTIRGVNPVVRMAAPTRRLRSGMQRYADVEPETRTWIDAMMVNQDSVLWDVGANVGVFSIYAAMRGLSVVAAEPAPQNLMILTRNIALNHVVERVTVLPIALSLSSGSARMKLSDLRFGSAENGFGTTDMFRGGAPRTPQSEFALAGISIDDAVAHLNLPPPTYLKIDVDGIELAILRGASIALRGVVEVCVELKHEPRVVEQIISTLAEAGLQLQHRSKRNGFFSRGG
jgi:FkbM family methyltransferase